MNLGYNNTRNERIISHSKRRIKIVILRTWQSQKPQQKAFSCFFSPLAFCCHIEERESDGEREREQETRVLIKCIIPSPFVTLNGKLVFQFRMLSGRHRRCTFHNYTEGGREGERKTIPNWRKNEHLASEKMVRQSQVTTTTATLTKVSSFPNSCLIFFLLYFFVSFFFLVSSSCFEKERV